MTSTAKDLGDLIVRLSLDSAKFDDGLKRLETQMTKAQTQFKSSATGLTDFGKRTLFYLLAAGYLLAGVSLERCPASSPALAAAYRG